MRFDISLPSFTEKDLDDATQRRRILEYLYRLTKQLKQTLNNIDDENMTDAYSKSMDNTQSIAELIQRTSGCVSGLQSLSSTVSALSSSLSSLSAAAALKTALVDEINAITGGARILADKLLLSGENHAVGNMTFGGETIDHCRRMPSLREAPNLKITGDALSYLTSPGTVQYFLGIDSVGQLRAFSAEVINGALTLSDAGTIMEGAVTSRNVQTIAITGAAVQGRKLPEDAAAAVAMTDTEKIYLYTASYFDWVYLTHELSITNGNVTAKTTISPMWANVGSVQNTKSTATCTL